jgi:ATP-dependent RNA helicase HelY
MACDVGDFDSYLQLRRSIGEREKLLARERGAGRKAEVAQAMSALRPGDVIRLPGGGRRGSRLGVVVDAGTRAGHESPRPTVVTDDKQVRRFAGSDFADPPTPVTRLRLAKDLQPRSPQARRELAARLKEVDAVPVRRRGASGGGADEEVAELRRQMRAHPCHSCPDREDHARWGERLIRLQKEADDLQRRMDNRTQSIARVFDRVVAVLTELGYLDGDTVTPAGLRLGRLYTELDLLAAECLRTGIWRGLAPAELASAASLLVYESRRDDRVSPKLPGGAARDAIEETLELAADLDSTERRHRLEARRVPDAGFAFAAYRWASGHRLEAILHENDLAAGDFVRWCKQLVDLLGQVAAASGDDPDLQTSARQAVAAVRRGIVATDLPTP